MVLVLIGLGLIAVAAASPAAAFRYSGGAVQLDPLHFLYRQAFWVAVGLPVMLGISMLSRTMATRAAVAGFCAFFLCCSPCPSSARKPTAPCAGSLSAASSSSPSNS
jgi:cell division protein FtsW